jgi:hypothetical protein
VHAVLKAAEERAASMTASGEVGQTLGPVFGSDAEAPTIGPTFEAVSTATKGCRKNRRSRSTSTSVPFAR